MAAGIVYHNITTATGVTFSIACWVPNTATPDVGAIPVTTPIFSDGTVIADATGMKISTSQLAALATAGQAMSAGYTPVALPTDQPAIPAKMAISATANGGTASRINAAASNNLTSVKASAGQLYAIDVFNVAAYNVFLKLYNKASAPVVASDTPIMTIPIQAGGGYSKTWPMGKSFSLGIAYAIVKLQADTDATNVVAGDLTGSIDWI